MVLVNGSDGSGAGWTTRVPNHDIREVVANCERMIDGLEPFPMVGTLINLMVCQNNIISFLVTKI